MIPWRKAPPLDETVKLVRHWFRLPRAVRKERIGTNISIRVSTYINKTKHFRKWEGAALGVSYGFGFTAK